MCEYFLFMCITWVPGANGDKKKVLDRLERKLQMVVRGHTGAGNPKLDSL